MTIHVTSSKHCSTNLIEQICKLLATYLKRNYVRRTGLNKYISVFMKRQTLQSLISLKNDPQAKALTLEYLQSFQVIQDVIQSNLNEDCLFHIKELFLKLSQ